jgi:hypothetical protein
MQHEGTRDSHGGNKTLHRKEETQMSATAGTPTVIINNFNVFEAIVPITLAGSYTTGGGDTLSFLGIVASNSVPLFVDIQEMPPAGTVASGILWRFAVGTSQANGKLQAFIPGGTAAAQVFTGESYTPAGTNSAPTITTSSGGVSTALGVAAGALSEVTGASGITGVQAPVFTGTAHTLAGTNASSAVTGAATELGSVTYASVSAGHLYARVVFSKFS